jgi:cobalt-zinc-cadmium efflux system outer membrane protein
MTQIELLNMFQDAYKIANINLLELQDIKNKVIETKQRLIKIQTALNQNAIISNYIQGSYNE